MDANILGFLVIALMGVVIYATRIAGSEVMSLFDMTPRLEAILKSMASSVLVAIVVSECVRGNLRVGAAIAVASITMLVFRNPLVAMSAGMICAAAFTFSHG